MSALYSAVNNAIHSIHNCADEPITVPGSIQPHGFLLLINPQSGMINLCSQNTGTYLNLTPEQILSKKYNEVLTAELVTIIATPNIGDEFPPVQLSLNNQLFNCWCRMSGDSILLEAVLRSASNDTLYDLFRHTNGLSQLTQGSMSFQEVSEHIADQIREIIRFDRVMVYKFDELNNGHVYAESVGEGIDSYLGLHYPSTDIPEQARQLYLKNLIRLIPDVHYSPVPLVTLDPALAKPETADLTKVHLRSVSPIHIQYLKNMGVAATFTISLIKDKQLWGLMACHNNTPRSIDFAQQLEAYFLTQLLTSQIDVQEIAEKYTLTTALTGHLQTLTAKLEGESNFIELHFEHMPEVLSLVNASGCALLYKEKIFRQGKTPSDNFIRELHRFLQEKKDAVFKTDQLSLLYPPAKDHANEAAGLLYYQLNTNGQPAIFWFRKSADQEVLWAGKPEPSGKEGLLTPRTSFAAWKEIKRGVSEKWQQPQFDMALQFAYQLQKHLAFLGQREEEIKFRRLNEQLIKANKELENINWISTHDLKEPLRKIQIYASMIDGPIPVDNANTLKNSIERIKAAAVRMQRFIDDLLLYSRMSTAEQAYEYISLDEILNKTLEDFHDEATQKLFVINRQPLPSINASRFQMGQLFLNLIGNAIKFRKDNQIQQISITYNRQEETLPYGNKSNWDIITITDTGVGFDASMSHSIFEVFKRAHSQEKFKGTGVGLSICRKIMENHGGRIVARGEEGKGASFALYFPVNKPLA